MIYHCKDNKRFCKYIRHNKYVQLFSFPFLISVLVLFYDSLVVVVAQELKVQALYCLYSLKTVNSQCHYAYERILLPGRWQSKTPILSRKVDQNR